MCGVWFCFVHCSGGFLFFWGLKVYGGWVLLVGLLIPFILLVVWFGVIECWIVDLFIFYWVWVSVGSAFVGGVLLFVSVLWGGVGRVGSAVFGGVLVDVVLD